MTDNINHIREFNLRASHGVVEYGTYQLFFPYQPAPEPITFMRWHGDNYTQALFYDSGVGGADTVYWIIPLRGILPDHAKIIYAELTAHANPIFTDHSDICIGYNYSNASYDESSTINFGSSIAEQSVRVTINRLVGQDDLQIYVKSYLESSNNGMVWTSVVLQWVVD
jgi:hypothetical protein